MQTPKERMIAELQEAGKLIIEEAEHICGSRQIDAANAELDIHIHAGASCVTKVEVTTYYATPEGIVIPLSKLNGAPFLAGHSTKNSANSRTK